MTTRREWGDLPEQVRRAVEDRTGPILKAESATSGRNSELASTLWTAEGPLFCKGVTTASPLSVMHHNEIGVSPFLPSDLAPRLLWHVEEGGWLLLGFEYVPGQHADFSPNSPDIPSVTAAIRTVTSLPAPPSSAGRRAMSTQWSRALSAEIESAPSDGSTGWSIENAATLTRWASRAPEYIDGSALIHTDMNPANVLVSDSVRVIDWAWWRTGAAWIDPAFAIIRFIAAGHSPSQAEELAGEIPSFRQADAEGVTAFSASVLRLWERKFAGTAPTIAACQWVRYRLEK
ncbi:phosphotransferase [Actinokineospora sp. NBRC 105648]|uniref:phosphotransferase n=1 Tax=Actinokineospora sp. NBRC 105648 TaxID=3032206 RepID=UPI0024A4FEE1|nr:phosphotransferase [Actinokineospora sp. NBRC 105648]GLZ40920.1 hypothetical protein Acsp05_45440 [Actinokineospora sp. NBRC 105648]